jgi:hypothetical protein
LGKPTPQDQKLNQGQPSKSWHYRCKNYKLAMRQDIPDTQEEVLIVQEEDLQDDSDSAALTPQEESGETIEESVESMDFQEPTTEEVNMEGEMHKIMQMDAEFYQQSKPTGLGEPKWTVVLQRCTVGT